MSDSLDSIVEILKQMELLRGVDSRALQRVAAVIAPIELKAGESPYEDHKVDDRFFLIISGRVKIENEEKAGKQSRKVKRSFTGGYFFGCEKLLYDQTWLQAAEAVETTLLYAIEEKVLATLLTEIPRLRGNMRAVGKIYRLAFGKHYSWLNEDETIIFVETEHLAYLIISLLAPLMVAWGAVIPLYIGWMSDVASFRIAALALAGVVFALAAFWAVWRWLDWQNDHYILTSQRVLWLERVIMLYDSRREGPLVTKQSTDTKSTFISRQLGYGSVTIRFLNSELTFRNIPKPKEVKALIDKHSDLARQSARNDETLAMEREIRKRIGLERPSGGAAPAPAPGKPPQSPAPANKPPAAPAKESVTRPKNFATWLADYFKTRLVDDKGVITYRKHWFTLLKKIGAPSLLVAATLAGMVFLLWMNGTEQGAFLSPAASILFGLFLAGIGALWWLYQYVDWRNDIYQITADKITDSEKKPLGDEKTKSAPLENIQSLEHERVGLLGLIFNFGNVVISVGSGDKFIFVDVANPAQAQQDIFDHMYAYRKQKEEKTASAERVRVADWVSAYHRQVNPPTKP